MYKFLCINMLLVALYVSGAVAGGTTVDELAKSTASWNGASLPDFDTGETEVTVLRITVAPDTALPVHIHPVINVAYMLSGELTVVSEAGERKTIQQGDALIELVDQEHYGMNESDEPAELVVVYFGTKGLPITVKKQE